MAVLRHGLFDSKSQQELMIAVLQEQSNSGDDHPAEHDRNELRRKALEDLPESELSCQQIELNSV